tara:strand:- start:349 stop:636 length:288 start_codon:yes stop_codon:yes gene_type:complete
MTTLSYYQHQDHTAPAAVVRYTIIGDDNRPLDVQQIRYENNPVEVSELQQDITAALESDIDVCLLTYKNLIDFKDLNAYLESIGYYSTNTQNLNE